jgi:hypothetical protein
MPRCSVTGFSYLEGLRDAFAVPPLADRRLTSGWGRRTIANADDEGASLSSHRKWFRPRFLWFMRMLVSEEITAELRLPYGLSNSAWTAVGKLRLDWLLLSHPMLECAFVRANVPSPGCKCAMARGKQGVEVHGRSAAKPYPEGISANCAIACRCLTDCLFRSKAYWKPNIVPEKPILRCKFFAISN